MLILTCSAVFSAGCTQGTDPALPADPVPVTVPDLSNLVIRPAEVPACFSLTSQHIKEQGGVGQLARDLGWQAGYEVTYTCPAEGPEPTVIVHTIAVYPAVNVPGIASMVDGQDRHAGYTFEDLEFSDRYVAMRGFYGTAGGVQDAGISLADPLVASGRDIPGTTAGPGSDMAEIIIYRGTIFEVMRMTGPGTNATVLSNLAATAAEKFP